MGVYSVHRDHLKVGLGCNTLDPRFNFPCNQYLTSLLDPPKRPLSELRYLLRSDYLNIETLVIHLVDDLNLLPQNLTAKQIEMMILGWGTAQVGYSPVQYPRRSLNCHSGQDSKA